ncbi:MAG: hypothetical protein QG658_310 [Patescibacteria group bacterium]|nr:hypothetical protein [Patescibacteria group bacterium]
MRGPIDYIVVGFPGNNFKGEALGELAAEVEKGTIGVLDLAVISKDEEGNVTEVELTDQAGIADILPIDTSRGLITEEDVEEVANVLDENCSAGLLIIEHLWAKGLKQAILNADGVLLAEGRIHPEAYAELTEKGGE